MTAPDPLSALRFKGVESCANSCRKEYARKAVFLTISSLPQTTYNRGLRLSPAHRHPSCRTDIRQLPVIPPASRSTPANPRRLAA